MISKILLIACIVSFNFLANFDPAMAGSVTTLTLIEKDGVTTNNYPLTFGHIFKQGDVPSGILVKYNGTVLPTQFDKKTSWEDGSVKYGVVSIVLPNVTANSTSTISIETSGANSTDGALGKTEILSTDVESNITLTNLSDSGYSGTVTSSLRDQIDSDALKYWLQGSICTEILETQQLNNSLNAAWEARFYPGTSFGVRISNSIENVNILYRGNVDYDVSISVGETTPTTVYNKSGFSNLHGSRWRKVFWLGVAPPETELHYDTNYLISTGAFMPYDTTISITESTIAAEYSAWLATSRDIGDSGFMNKDFGSTGGRREIGILPKWDAMLLLSWDNRIKQIALKQAELAGGVPRSHWRETDTSKSNYGGVVTIDDRERYDLNEDAEGGIPVAIGTKDKLGWIPDRAHMGSYGYTAYLITGDYWYLQETLFWGAYALSFDNYGRNGDGNFQKFSSGNTYSFGLVYEPPRGIAWALRSISYAAFVALDGSIESTYFKNKLNNNINWFLLANTASSHGLHAFRGSREDTYPTSSWNLRIATWMHDFVVLSLSDIIRKKTANVTNTQILRDRIGLFTIGRVTNHPSMNKWDGTGYIYPLAKENSTTDYYADGDWAKFWADCQEMNIDLNLKQGYPHSSLSHYDYADSYASIEAAALAALPAGAEAYAFVYSNLTAANFTINPTWAIVPTGGGPSCIDVIQNGDETGVDCGGSCPNACSTPGVGVRPLAISGRPISSSGRPIAP